MRIVYGRGLGWKGHIKCMVGDCKRVCFWHDVWCGDFVLKDLFPELFAITANREDIVYSL